MVILLKSRVGNDIVDLKEPSAQGKGERFLRRVCSEEELQVVKEATDPHRALWTFWAMKEATYKAVMKQEKGVLFIPPEFVCRYKDGKWRCRGATLELMESSEFVHAIALIGNEAEVLSAIREESNGSHAVRQLALELLEQKGIEDCEIVRREQEGRLLPPQILQNGRPLAGCDMSLSHDGRYVAATVVFCSISASASPIV